MIGQAYTYVLQDDISGTASAVKACVSYLEDGDSVLMLNGDHPLLTSERFQK
jgi:bifunctional N-acetylglucosamine-1-phosphate-uridyltransferase/glucosamine-1-phosphate-acetyltransferase GlmU-like protein